MQTSPAIEPFSAASGPGNPYAAPREEPAQVVASAKKPNRHGLLHLLLAVSLFLGTLSAMALTESRTPGIIGFLAVTLVALLGIGRGFATLVRSFLSAQRGGLATFLAVVGVLGNGLMAAAGALAALMSTVSFSRGRQLRRFGKVLLPDVGTGADWAALPMQIDVDESTRADLAAQWRENGRTEHASVAAFARLTLDLMALGAPPALVAAANRDALDEIRHTELCFSIARALDGASKSPAAFPAAARARTLPPTRTLALVALAVDSLVDGALHEGVSARVIAKLVKRCEEPRIRAALKEIAADEGRHAAHGWDVVEWCLAEGGAPVADALRGAMQALPRAMHGELPQAAENGGWERHGIHGRQLESDEYRKTLADLLDRAGRMTAHRATAA